MYIPIKLPPGVYRNGTEYQSAGRWHDANLVRWYENTLRPVNGWRSKSASTVTGACRAIITWRDNDGDSYIGLGTHSKLFAMDVLGVLKDITPTGFTTGFIDATSTTGYGKNLYGSFASGVPRPDTGAADIATTWSLDTWGEYLVGCSSTDGKLYEWQLGFSTPTLAAVITNAPTSCSAIMVTSERIMFALGASGNPRLVKWCDQENNTVWTAASTNQAGDFELATPGSLKCGKRVRGVNILFTDVDAHVASYIGLPYVYSFEKVGSGCGVISAQAVAAIDTSCMWMSQSGFWSYDGYVKPMACDVGDYVFNGMNLNQASKVYAVHNSAFGEVTWFYPSLSSNEVDSYVTYSYREGHWSIGLLARTAGTDRGVFVNPMMVGTDGYVYDHEVGFTYDSVSPYAQSGPIELGNGDNVMAVRSVIPDEQTLGEVAISFTARMYPTSAETSYGPFSAKAPTDARFTGRSVKMKVTGNVLEDWRVGVMRLEATSAGKR